MNIVKELCIRRGISQKQVALSVGVSQPTVSDWFNNKTDPSGERLERLSCFLGVSRAVILGFDPDPDAPENKQQTRTDDQSISTWPEIEAILRTLSPEKQEEAYRYMKFLEQENKQ